MKGNKENIITEILLELESGTNYTDCMVLNGTKWNLPKTTFVRYWNEANTRHKQTQIKAQKEINDISIEATKEAVKSGLKSKLERQLELQRMLEPDYKTKDFVSYDFKAKAPIIIERPLTPTELKNIHIELSKMDGSYAPTVVENTHKIKELIIKGKKFAKGDK